MASSANVATILLMCMLVAQPFATQAAITCGYVVISMLPCLSYLQDGGAVPAPCCGGVKSLFSTANTTEDRQTACTCLKSAAESVEGINVTNASGLPRACDVNIPFPIGPNTNCTAVV